MAKLLLFVALIALITTSEEPYKKIIHQFDPQAKCLDGSPPALYLHEGGDFTKFVIFFIGGGHCQGENIAQVLESCYARSKTPLGSSKMLPDLLLSEGGYLSTDPSIN